MPPLKPRLSRIIDAAKMVQDFSKRIFALVSDDLTHEMLVRFDEHDLLGKLTKWRQTEHHELDRQVDSDKLCRILIEDPKDSAHQSAPAMSIPIGTVAPQRFVRSPRVRVMFDQIVTPKFTKDLIEAEGSPEWPDQWAVDCGKDMGNEMTGKTLHTLDAWVGEVGVPLPGLTRVHNIHAANVDDAIKEVPVGMSFRVIGNTETIQKFLASNWERLTVVRIDCDQVSDNVLYFVAEGMQIGYEFLERPRLEAGFEDGMVYFRGWSVVGAVMYGTNNVYKISWPKTGDA